MKNLKRIILSLFLTIVMCFPVFMAVGCGEQNNEGEKSTVASDVANAYNDYIDLLVQKNNNLVDERNSEQEEELEAFDYPNAIPFPLPVPPTPEEEPDERDYEIQSLANQIQEMILKQKQFVYSAGFIDIVDQGKWFGIDDMAIKVVKIDNVYNFYEKSSFGNSIISFEYQDDKLAKIEMTSVHYDDFVQDSGKWKVNGVSSFMKYYFDIKTKTDGEMILFSYVNTNADEYFNYVEEFIKDYNAGNLMINKMDKYFNGMMLDVFINSTENRIDDPFLALKTFKKNIAKLEVKNFSVNIFDIEDITITNEEMYKIIEKNDAFMKKYTFLDDGYILSSDDVVDIDWKKAKELLTNLIAITEDYKEWQDDMSQFEEVPGQQLVYEPYDIELYTWTAEQMIGHFQAALASLDQEYMKETWFIPAGSLVIYAKAFDMGYSPIPQEEDHQDLICSYKGINMENEDGKKVYIYTFSNYQLGVNGEYGGFLEIKFDENKNLIGFRGGYIRPFEYLA